MSKRRVLSDGNGGHVEVIEFAAHMKIVTLLVSALTFFAGVGSFAFFHSRIPGHEVMVERVEHMQKTLDRIEASVSGWPEP